MEHYLSRKVCFRTDESKASGRVCLFAALSQLRKQQVHKNCLLWSERNSTRMPLVFSVGVLLASRQAVFFRKIGFVSRERLRSVQPVTACQRLAFLENAGSHAGYKNKKCIQFCLKYKRPSGVPIQFS